MPDIIMEIENELLSHIPLSLPRKIRATGYLTVANDNNQQLNEPYFYTIQGSRSQSVLSNLIEEFDLAPELSLKDAAEMTQQFINELPDDIIDVELGPGI